MGNPITGARPMTEQDLFYPAAPDWTYRWCTAGRHWGKTKHSGEPRKWVGRQCPSCVSAYQRQYQQDNRSTINAVRRRYWTANRDALNKYHREYYAANRTAWLERRRRHRERNREAILAWQRAYYKANRNALIARQREREAANPELLQAARQRNRIRRNFRYAQLVCADGFGCWRRAVNAMPKVCVYCGGRDDIHADHTVPLARGGPHCGDNCQPVCRSCNSSKSDRDPIEFAQSLGRLF